MVLITSSTIWNSKLLSKSITLDDASKSLLNTNTLSIFQRLTQLIVSKGKN